MIKKWLSRIGIGSARVDLALEKLEYMPGEVVTGQFLLIGGAVERVNFTFRLPEDLQPTEEDVSYWFKTTLHFDEGTASKDQDEIRIVPSDG
ncbi:sporulation protein [Bacillus thermotolerans]|uniref:Sporulation protein n=1 Tax=Bacillus thermotolerans TaxID=1221996 RepID=A0A0F5HUJ8_BACTR|nr:sporulation protein [Bacillus thermotolerans]KKB33880.1 hypothetical protein QY97_02961 [Bacillus thermotolerans]KKB36720.1 hypothetical protein QY95_02988 [Bacillus thermotolerans]